MTHIVVNTRMLISGRLDGIGWFAYQTLKRLTMNHPEIDFTFLFDRSYNNEFIFGKNVTPIVLRPPVRHTILYYLWYQVSVKSFLKKTKPDLFLSPDGLLPIGVACKQLAVVHDINFKHYPKDLPFLISRYFNWQFPKSVHAATRIATVSEYSKSDIAKEYEIDPLTIDVVYNGVNDGFAPAKPEDKTATKDRFSHGKEYFLFIGSIHPRKNIVRLLQAFDNYKLKSGSSKILVLAGSFFWGKAEIEKTLRNMTYGDDVIFTGRTHENDLFKLTAAAFCLVFVPYFEGFGIPLLEAMQSEIPIITSNTASLPEIAEQAAIYVDPFKIESITEAMVAIEDDRDLREKIVNYGRSQRQKFSWDATAEKLWASIQKAL